MGKPLNWMLSGVIPKKGPNRTLRNRLAATTILAVAPFLGYGRQAYAACVPSPSPTFICSGTSAGEDFTGLNAVDNANFQTAADPPFVVTTNGVDIEGDGNIRFTDNNASSITNTSGTGLSVISTGDISDGVDPDPDVPGAVTIITNGTITGTAHGIYSRNSGTGDLGITVSGVVTGQDVDEPPIGDYYPDNYIANDGINATNFGGNLTITSEVGSVVSGEHNGMDARNYGEGNLTITANGDVTGNEFDAIYARNFGNDLDITVGAESVVTGAANGIGAYNYGNGVLDIDVDGQVIGRQYNEVSEDYEGGDGIRAYTSGTGLDITTGAASIVYGDDNGIDARNFGDGAMQITAGGYVTGFDNDGIYALNHGTDLTITTGDQSVVRGGGHGIGAQNFGSGNLTIEANGWVGGYAYDSESGQSTGDGIHAYNSEDGEELTIITGAASTIRGANDGIDAFNEGYGALTITADGVVRGADGSGIYAWNDNFFGVSEDSGTGDFDALVITTGAGSDVFGSKDGIDAINYGGGFLKISVNGSVTGNGQFNDYDPYRDGDGIHALNHFSATGLTIETGAGSVVTGVGDDGIDAEQYGAGDLTITVNGTVTGRGEISEYGAGIDAFNAGGYFTYAADNVGIAAADYDGIAETNITIGAGGVAQGDFAGIRARSYAYVPDDAPPISITNDGLVRNLSADSSDLAIFTSGGVTNIDNNGNLLGTVFLNADAFFDFDDRLDNDGTWNSAAGTSDFGEGIDVVDNAGLLIAADGGADNEVTTINNLEEFYNSGLVSLVDGKEGDELHLNATGGTFYQGEDGDLAVDAFLGPTGLSDRLFVSGNTDGSTLVSVNVVGANGANFDGIPVVEVDGNTAEEHFDLNGPVSGGFFLWDMRLDTTNNWHELYTLTTGGDPNDPNNPGDPVLGGGSFEFPTGFAGTADVWYLTIGTLLHRQADLRALLQNMSVTPAADYGEPVEPTPVAGALMAPGFWYKAFGAYVDRDDEQDGFDLDRKQTLYGGMAGFDFGTEEAFGDAWLFGVFGGYVVSDLDFKATNSEWSYEGPMVGAYVTYLDQAFYADLTVKADFLDIDIDPEDLDPAADDADTDAVNIGGRLDAGYKFGHTVFIEPQASLAVLHTEIDDVDIFGGTVEFEDETSVRGRLGLRLGVDHTRADATVYSADVTASVWENFTGDTEVTIVDTGVPDFGVSDDAETTYGDLSLGLSIANPDGWSAFVRGNYLFAEDYEAVTGNAGVRFVW